MADSADNLRASIIDYISAKLPEYSSVPDKKIPYFDDYMVFGGDGVWKVSNQQNLFLLMEQKSLQEAKDSSSTWWNWNSYRANNGLGHYNLSGYRSLISHVLGIDPRDRKTSQIRRVYKWMQIIAQLRHDVLNLDHIRIRYRSTFALPLEELENFRTSFQVFHSSYILNPFRHNQEVIIEEWHQTLRYSDTKYGNVETIIVEVRCENYFSPMMNMI